MRPRQRYLALLLWLATVSPAIAQGSGYNSIDELQTQMYKLFYTEDSLNFYQVIGELKNQCLMAKNEQVFYKAWGNHAIYESTHQRRNHALEIAKEMKTYADQEESTFGTYTAIHVMGSIYQQMRDYDSAEKTFLEAIDFLHKNAPEESAAADYIELTLVAVNGKSNVKQGLAYAEAALKEPNISDQHQLRVLSMLCQIEDDKPEPDKETFLKFFQQREEVLKRTPPDSPDKTLRVVYQMLIGNYEKALELSANLKPEQRDFERARIYHIMGQDDKAYEQMLDYKSRRDSVYRAERTGLLSDYISQLTNERLELEKKNLEEQRRKWRNYFIYTLAAFIVTILVFITWQRIKQVRKLRAHNVQPGKAHQEEKEARIAEQELRIEAEKQLDIKREFLNNIAQELRSPLNPITGFSDLLADSEIELQPEEREMMSQHIKDNSKLLTGIIDNMIELSLYESKSSLPKDDTFNPNVIAQNAIDFTKPLCKEGVEIGLITQVNDQMTIKSDLTAVGKVLRHLLSNAAKYTEKGGITLLCTDEGKTIRYTVTDTGTGIEAEHVSHIFDPVAHNGSSVKTTGMGLAISYRITKLLGGTLTYDTTYKRGSRFIFEIPKQ